MMKIIVLLLTEVIQILNYPAGHHYCCLISIYAEVDMTLEQLVIDRFPFCLTHCKVSPPTCTKSNNRESSRTKTKGWIIIQSRGASHILIGTVSAPVFSFYFLSPHTTFSEKKSVWMKYLWKERWTESPGKEVEFPCVLRWEQRGQTCCPSPFISGFKLSFRVQVRISLNARGFECLFVSATHILGLWCTLILPQSEYFSACVTVGCWHCCPCWFF